MNHPNGYYRVDNMLQQGAALIQAAHEFRNPEWEATGRKMNDVIYEDAWFKQYRCFAITVDDLLCPLTEPTEVSVTSIPTRPSIATTTAAIRSTAA